ncbi:hypothetical protein NC652_032608 [Populus alba x Populus x berolinensis]|nr:hypothetical protein NC652_032608 [Populus alba x Populus x berolinensis]
MGTPSEMKPAYIATLEEDWKSLAEFYEKHKDRLLTPMPFTKDTAFHMAVYCKDAKLLKCLLDSARYLPTSQDHKHPISITNVYGHTPLHLSASRGNYEAVKLLVEESQKILVGESENERTDIMLMKNKLGETPLFSAAAFGQTEIVKYLTRQPAHIVNDELLLVHRQRNDGQSILHVAVFRLKMSVMGQSMKIPQEFGKLWRVAKGGKGIVDLAAMSTESSPGNATGKNITNQNISSLVFHSFVYLTTIGCSFAVLEWINGSIRRFSFKGISPHPKSQPNSKC